MTAQKRTIRLLDLEQPEGGWPSKPVGSSNALRELANMIVARAKASGSIQSVPAWMTDNDGLRSRLAFLANRLLRDLAVYRTSPSLTEEEKVVATARHAAVVLRNALSSLQSVGSVMIELQGIGAGLPNEAERLPSAAKTAKALTHQGWMPGYHPLDALNRGLAAYEKSLRSLPRKGRESLVERQRGDPRRVFVTGCAAVYRDWLGPGSIPRSSASDFARFVAALWAYATGTDAGGANLAEFAKAEGTASSRRQGGQYPQISVD